MEKHDNIVNETQPSELQNEFKKPILVGRIGKLPKKAAIETSAEKEESEKLKTPKTECVSNNLLTPATSLVKDMSPLTYKEPKWSGLCPDGTDYSLEVLKSGMIVENIGLTKKPYYVFGRLPSCDVELAHPTISRFHAVLQYKAFAEEDEPPPGWYMYDLGSTHGTFLNKERVKSNRYTRVRVGHQIKFGNSTRTYIMMGPDFDCEGESELSVTEIKKRSEDMKLERDRIIKEAIEKREKEKIENEKRREEQGIDWGMGEDAEEEVDLADNPYAVTTNEELYLEDPKKTLRGYFEREGHELNYDCEERGVGQFMCRVELPIDDAAGRPVMAEVMHRGKKKEAVIACALEACRILDRAGLLRQAKHESRRRKERDWSADDYYDSDEDTFLDRTGSVERKRKMRMQKHGACDQDRNKPHTYEDLLKQISDIEKKISSEERILEQLRTSNKPVMQTNDEEDALDEYMNSLGGQGHSMARKAEISNTKMTIQKLKVELSKTQRLAELARPADMPPLMKKDDSKMTVKVGTNSVIYGKRIKLKEDGIKRHKVKEPLIKKEEEFVEEMDSDDEPPLEEISKTNNDLCASEKVTNENDMKLDSVVDKENGNQHKSKSLETVTKVYGPMRPPDDYVIPVNYFDQETDRDLPEIMED